MRKNSFVIIAVLLVIVLLVSGCPLRKKPSKEVDELTSSEMKRIRSGTEGLVMEFVKNVPPDQIYSSEGLMAMVSVKNKGAENIEEAYFYAGGVDPNIVDFGADVREGAGLKEYFKIDYIPGKDELRGEHGETVLTFSSGAASLPTGTDVYEPNLVVTACYDYKTVASPVVCIDPNPFGVYTAAKACQPKTVTETGQGGPIVVTRVEQIPSRGKVQFKIYVENKGKGKAIYEEKFDTCNLIEPTDYMYVNKIDAYSVSLGELTPTQCQPDPYGLRLVDEKGVIICSFDGLSGSAYTTPLKIELLYNYMESTPPKKVKIIQI